MSEKQKTTSELDIPESLEKKARKAAKEEDIEVDSVLEEVEKRYQKTRIEPLEPVGTVSAQSIGEPGTQMTMNTFHYAGVAEIDVTQGLPRLIEIVDARKEPDTPVMTVYLKEEWATDREKASNVVYQIEETRVRTIGDIETDITGMEIRINVDENRMAERNIQPQQIKERIRKEVRSPGRDVAKELEEKGDIKGGRVSTKELEDAAVINVGGEEVLKIEIKITDEGNIRIIPDEKSRYYRLLLKLYETIREVVVEGIEGIERIVTRKEEIEKNLAVKKQETEDDMQLTAIPSNPAIKATVIEKETLEEWDSKEKIDENENYEFYNAKREEFVLYTEGSEFKELAEKVSSEDEDEKIEGVDMSRTYTNNIHEIEEVLGIEAARNSLIREMKETLQEQGLEVDIRHVMLVSDMMTNEGEIESIGRHGISGSKQSPLARAAFEVTVDHLLTAAIHGERDEVQGVAENVIVGQPIKMGTGDVDLVVGNPKKK